VIVLVSVAVGRSSNPLGFYSVLGALGALWSIFPGFFAASVKYMGPEWKAKYFTRRFFRIAGLLQLGIAVIGLLVLLFSSTDW
jgi:hypothetical protein